MHTGTPFPLAMTFWLALTMLASIWGCGPSASLNDDGPGTGSTVSAQSSAGSDGDATEATTTSVSDAADEPSSTDSGDGSSTAASTDSGDSIPSKATNDAANTTPGNRTAKATTSQPAQLISFDDLNLGMQVDVRFRPQMLEYDGGRVKELFGKKIIVAGYMNPTDTMRGVTEFILLRNLECKFGPGGQADHLVHVIMEEGLTTAFTDKIVYVEGILSLNPFPTDEPVTWSIYDVHATKVSTDAPPRNR